MSVYTSASIYFVFQGAAVALWWLLLLTVPASRVYFQMSDDSDATLLAFWLPDLLILAGGSFAAAYFSLRRDDFYTPAALWFLAGGVVYTNFYNLAFAFLTDKGWLGVSLMMPTLLLTVNCALAVTKTGARLFREAKTSNPAWNTIKTATQIFFFWGGFLFLVPFLITLLETKVGVARLEFPFQKTIAAAFLLSMSSLGLWSGFTIATRGAGTPLPLDSTNRLVVSGPYGFVRNPMAIAGFGQGLAIALWHGSLFVFVYVLTGIWIWQFLVRPLEEEDMARKFGADYEEYRRRVICWLPRLKPYESVKKEVSLASENLIKS